MLRGRLGLLCCSQLVATSALRLPSAAAPFVRCAAPHRGVLARMMCDDAPPPPTFGMLDVRVGKIAEAGEHPDSDKLWVEKTDVGEVEVEGEGEEAKGRRRRARSRRACARTTRRPPTSRAAR